MRLLLVLLTAFQLYNENADPGWWVVFGIATLICYMKFANDTRGG